MVLEGRSTSFVDDAAQMALQPEIIRLLARRTAAALPQAFEPSLNVEVVADEKAGSLIFKPQPRPAWSSSVKLVDDGRNYNNVSDSLAMSTTLQPSFDQSFSQPSFVSSQLPEKGLSGSTIVQPQVGLTWKTRPVMTPEGDMTWNSCHNMQWDRSQYLSSGFQQECTAQVCSCGKVYGPDDTSCRRCGSRRPAPPPEPVPRMHKAMHMMDPNHPDVFERNNAWATVYSEKLFRSQMIKFEENEGFMEEHGYFQPRINEKSIKIVENKAVPPIHQRTKEILSKRNEYLESKRRQKEDRELAGHTFTPKICPKSARRTGWTEDSLFRWDEKRAQKTKFKEQQQLATEAGRCPFSPRIGGKSKDIVQGYACNKPVHERLVSDSKRRTMEYLQEQNIVKSMQPQDFENMWVDERKPSVKMFARMAPSSPGSEPSKVSPISERDGSVAEARAQLNHRASSALLFDIKSLQQNNNKRASRSPIIGRQSRMSRVSRFSKATVTSKMSAPMVEQSRAAKALISTSGINTINLNGDFADIADSLLPS